MPLILGVGYQLEVGGVPAGVDAATVMQLHALRNGTAEEFPPEPVGVAVLGLGDPPVWGRRPGEAPASAQLRMGRPEDGAVDQALKLGAAVPAAAHLDVSRLDHAGGELTIRS